uniref:Uncharacterized protein n=1 Tax=Arundo donax TaxID=35708 RepID=A0A0A8YT81_ARUDO
MNRLARQETLLVGNLYDGKPVMLQHHIELNSCFRSQLCTMVLFGNKL